MNIEERIENITEQLFVYGNLDIIDSYFDVAYCAHDGDRKHKGQNFVKQFIKKLRTAIPDINIIKIEFLCQDENIITWQRTFSGTHKAEMQGIPASNKKLNWNEIVVTRFEGEKIIEDWVVSNLAFKLMINQSVTK